MDMKNPKTRVHCRRKASNEHGSLGIILKVKIVTSHSKSARVISQLAANILKLIRLELGTAGHEAVRSVINETSDAVVIANVGETVSNRESLVVDQVAYLSWKGQERRHLLLLVWGGDGR